MKISYDYIKKMPKALPKGLMEYIRTSVLPEDNTLLYDRKHPSTGYCYLCGQAVKLPSGRFRQDYGYYECPSCGKRVNTYLMDGDRFGKTFITNVATIQKGRDGVIWIREWHLLRGTTNKVTAANLQPIEAWAIKDNEVFKWAIEEKVAWSMMSFDRVRSEQYFKSKRIVYTLDGLYSFYLPESWREIVKGSPLQYLDMEAAVRDIKNTDVIRLMLDWVRYPAIEKLQKAGFTGLVQERLCGRDRYRSIKWKKNDIEAALGFPLRIVDNSEYSRRDFDLERAAAYRAAWDLYEAGKIKERDIEELASKRSAAHIKELGPAWGHASCQKILEYAMCGGGSQSLWLYWGLYRDYLNDCVRLGFDLSDKSVLFPKNLRAAHQRTIDLVQYEEHKEDIEKFAKRVKTLEKMSFDSDKFLIRPAGSEKELIDEGSVLHHCVAGYARSMAAGRTAIFFIRKKAEPDVPYFTLEYRDEQLVQCRTLHNRSYDTEPEVQAFIKAWLENIKAANNRKAA